MELEITLPKMAVGFKLPGVYRILFEDGMFYIGCSADLRSRSESWRAFMRNPERARGEAMGADMAAKIAAGGRARMDILELCDPDLVKDMEALYLNEYREDPLMISVAECQFKPVLQYKRDGSFVKRHISITAAAKYNNTTLWRIQEVLNGNRLSHKEMVFIYESGYENRRKVINKHRYTLGLPRRSTGMKVIQKSLEGALIATYDTYVMAAQAVGCTSLNIKRAIAGRQQTAAGFKWALSEE